MEKLTTYTRPTFNGVLHKVYRKGFEKSKYFHCAEKLAYITFLLVTAEPMNVNLTGTIEHYSSLFALSKLFNGYAKKEAVAIKYDFSKSKTGLFVKSLEH